MNIFAQGKYDEADKLYVRAIDIGEKVYGRCHSTLSKWFNNRAVLIAEQVNANGHRSFGQRGSSG